MMFKDDDTPPPPPPPPPQLLPDFNYDQMVSPRSQMKIGIQIEEVQTLDDLKQTLQMTAAFTIQWEDPRLRPPTDM